MKIFGRKYKLNKYLVFVGILIFISLCFFIASYFFNESVLQSEFVLFNFLLSSIPYLVVSVVFWAMQPIATWKKPFIITATTLLGAATGVLLVLSTFYLPGSRNKAYVESICSSVVLKHYGVKNITDLPTSHPAFDLGQTFYRRYAQQAECVENFYNGKKPVFSENPPGFLPVTSSQTTSQTPPGDAKHSGEGNIEYANIEQGSGAQLLGIEGVGSFAVTNQTTIYDENNKQVAFSYLRKGQKVRVSGAPGEGYLQALEIKVLE